MSTFISLHAAPREAAERGSAVAEALRAPRVHTRASVADELARPAAGRHDLGVDSPAKAYLKAAELVDSVLAPDEEAAS